MKKYISQIEDIWQIRQELITKKYSDEFKSARKIIRIVINELDKGKERVCYKTDDGWKVNEWAKKCILLSFMMHESEQYTAGPIQWFDKVPPKFNLEWEDENFIQEKLRIVPGAFIRKGAYLGQNTVVMPSFINIGAYIDDNTMIDTWATIGSCAQIGKNCHISGGVGIGGVLEPLQSMPVIIEDNCFIGARSEIAEGVIVEEGSVLGMGVYIGASTKIVDRHTGEITYGRVPSYSVVVPGTLPHSDPTKPSLYCAVIVKKVDEQTRKKTAINELLRFDSDDLKA